MELNQQVSMSDVINSSVEITNDRVTLVEGDASLKTRGYGRVLDVAKGSTARDIDIHHRPIFSSYLGAAETERVVTYEILNAMDSDFSAVVGLLTYEDMRDIGRLIAERSFFENVVRMFPEQLRIRVGSSPFTVVDMQRRVASVCRANGITKEPVIDVMTMLMIDAFSDVAIIKSGARLSRVVRRRFDAICEPTYDTVRDVMQTAIMRTKLQSALFELRKSLQSIKATGSEIYVHTQTPVYSIALTKFAADLRYAELRADIVPEVMTAIRIRALMDVSRFDAEYENVVNHPVITKYLGNYTLVKAALGMSIEKTFVAPSYVIATLLQEFDALFASDTDYKMQSINVLTNCVSIQRNANVITLSLNDNKPATGKVNVVSTFGDGVYAGAKRIVTHSVESAFVSASQLFRENVRLYEEATAIIDESVASAMAIWHEAVNPLQQVRRLHLLSTDANVEQIAELFAAASGRMVYRRSGSHRSMALVLARSDFDDDIVMDDTAGFGAVYEDLTMILATRQVRQQGKGNFYQDVVIDYAKLMSSALTFADENATQLRKFALTASFRLNLQRGQDEPVQVKSEVSILPSVYQSTREDLMILEEARARRVAERFMLAFVGATQVTMSGLKNEETQSVINNTIMMGLARAFTHIVNGNEWMRRAIADAVVNSGVTGGDSVSSQSSIMLRNVRTLIAGARAVIPLELALYGEYKRDNTLWTGWTHATNRCFRNETFRALVLQGVKPYAAV